jgi:hypothetical protein
MWNRGKLVIFAMLSLALLAALFSMWYHYQGGDRTRDFFGTPTALLFVAAPEIVALRLEATAQAEPEFEGMEPEPPEGPSVEFNNQFWKVTGDADVIQAKGIANIRQALVQDVCYDWRAAPPKEPANWQYALEFNDGKLWATVLFDFDSRQLALAGGKRSAMLDAAVNADWKQFFAEQFADERTEAAASKELASESEKSTTDADAENPETVEAATPAVEEKLSTEPADSAPN